MDKDFLMSLETPDFTAVVRPLSSIPGTKLMEMISETNPGRQFSIAVELLRDELPAEKTSEYDSLSMPELTEVITRWIESY
jgi:hypothetical protein